MLSNINKPNIALDWVVNTNRDHPPPTINTDSNKMNDEFQSNNFLMVKIPYIIFFLFISFLFYI